jgi:hypothetical protein
VDAEGPPIAGCAVLGVRRHGHQVLVELSDDFQLVVEAAFAVTATGGADRVDPQDPTAELAQRLLALVGCTVAATSSTSGDLRVECDGGTALEVPASDAGEAWQLLGPDGYLVVCLPGGEPAVWSGE